MLIPVSQLSKDTLYNVAEAFVLREGTDYGDEEVPLKHKVEQVIAQLQSGEAVLLYSELHETVDIISKTAYQDMLQETNDEAR